MLSMETMEIRNESELGSVVEKAIRKLQEAPRENNASVLALSGELGAGKTTFVKEFAKQLGVEEEVTSPTFVIMKLYTLSEDAPYACLAHIDAYRIAHEDEMRVLHFDELLARNDTVVCIEWAENIQSLLPKHAVHMRIEIEKETRLITFS